MRGAALLISAAVAVPLLVALGLPANLFGSGPADWHWQAEASDIRVVDGETLALGDRVVRLAGIAAPMRGEACRRADGERFDCGGASAAALMRLVDGRPVSCRITGRDAFGRGVGQCESNGTDLSRMLVGNGFAVATGSAMRSAEATARQGDRGLWASRTGAPMDWHGRE
ncbi:thermonuclease family protein [Roseomonas terrae]|uniref:Thermonuclease family protein n=1 Tax=Neoroseomonas terrae TaxID=424799 RepID=A0ABS5EKV3_9PROT|nr:thermonuclease family protein [Neoroseomonas terrae]MBR0651646.1 thermonuclease family protein [Neoroseomonas terrae]